MNFTLNNKGSLKHLKTHSVNFKKELIFLGMKFPIVALAQIGRTVKVTTK